MIAGTTDAAIRRLSQDCNAVWRSEVYSAEMNLRCDVLEEAQRGATYGIQIIKCCKHCMVQPAGE